MKKIDFQEPDTVEWRKWRKKCDATTKANIAAFKKAGEVAITNLYTQQKAAFASLTTGFFGKCAYCEAKITSTQRGDIDHYRPKKQPTELDWTPVVVRKNGRLVAHTGYYWLAYDWQNLLLSCLLCNQVAKDREYGKGARFPVDSYRAFTPAKVRLEDPLLLNPRFDDPAAHLEIDDTGTLVGTTKKGVVTIEMLGLNKRDLPRARAKKYQAIQDRFSVIMASIRQDPAAAIRDAKSLLNQDDEFTIAARAASLKMSESLASLLAAI